MSGQPETVDLDLTQEDLAALLRVAREAALAAGALARALLAEPREINSKGRRDIVTDADLAAQEVITGRIRAAFPDHGFMPEEANSDLPTAGPVIWIIDPVDGTTNYSRGVPIFSVSVAAVRNRAPELATADDLLAAVVYDPMRDELFSAVCGGPALLNGAPLQVSAVADLSAALIGFDWSHEPPLREVGQQTVAALLQDIDVFRTIGSAALALAWVAAGRLDAYVNYHLKPWDVAAAALLLRQAGGSMVTLAGEPTRLDPRGLDCLAANGRLQETLTARLVRPYP